MSDLKVYQSQGAFYCIKSHFKFAEDTFADAECRGGEVRNRNGGTDTQVNDLNSSSSALWGEK